MKARIQIGVTLMAMLGAGVCLSGESRVERVTLNSAALQTTKRFNIYLPPDYDQNVNERYPVLYVFRGHEDEWLNSREDNSRQTNLKAIVDELLASNAIDKMIVVMPGLTSDDRRVETYGINMRHPELASDPSGLGTGRFDDYLVQELIPYVDDNYRTRPERSQRALDGFSAGGYTALHLVLRHPELFCSVGAYDAGMPWLNHDDPDQPGPWDDEWLTWDLFDPHYGKPPRDVQAMLRYNPPTLLQEANATSLAHLLAMQFLLHSTGPGASDSDLRTNQHFIEVMQSRNLVNSFDNLSLTPNAVHNWFYADEHIRATLPLHSARFRNPGAARKVLPMQLLHPLAGAVLSGPVEIRWTTGEKIDDATTEIAYSRDDGRNWNVLATVAASDTVFVWNTAEESDGARYLLRVLVIGDSVAGGAQTAARFSVNNPANALPEIEMVSPYYRNVISGNWTIRWFAGDADGDPLSFAMDFSVDDGSTWHRLFENYSGSTEYAWNTLLAENSKTYRLRLHAADGSAEVETTSEVFEVFNERTFLPEAHIQHVAGTGGKVQVGVADPALLNGHVYRITFDDTTFNHKVYHVYDFDRGEQVVTNATPLDGTSEGPLFDGIRLLIRDFEKAEVNSALSGWVVGSSTLTTAISVAEIFLPPNNSIKGVAYPADYRVEIFDSVVDTSEAMYGAPANPMKFKVTNLTEGRQTPVVFIDYDHDQAISRLDQIFLLERNGQGGLQFTWRIYFGGAASATSPAPGDQFMLATYKPITAEDVYVFRAALSTSVHDSPVAQVPRSLQLFPNYPNPFNPETTISFHLSAPEYVRIAIYNVLGQKVSTLFDGRLESGRHARTWHGKNDAGLSVSSGVYFYRVAAGENIVTRKMLLAK